MEMHCHKGNNSGERGHAKWSPVATAWYRLLPRIDILEDVLDDEVRAPPALLGERQRRAASTCALFPPKHHPGPSLSSGI